MSDWVDYPEGSEWEDFPEPTPAPKKGKQPRERGLFEKIYDASGSILQGATFGYGDELTAGVGGALGGNYDEILAKDRGAQKQYEAENPYESMMFEIGGGLPLAFATPGAGAGALTKLATMGSQARSAKGLMGAGAAYGALTGAGKGEGEDDRLTQALVGGSLGFAIPGAVKLGGAALKPVAQRIGRSPVANTLANESGAILPGQAAAGLSPAEAKLFQQLRNIPTEKLTSMQDDMARALTEGTPLYLPEAGGKYGKRELTDFARYIANRKGGANFAEQAIGERAEQAGPRISSILDELSPERDSYRGGEALMQALDDKVVALDKVRDKQSSPLYQDTFRSYPEVPKADLGRLMQYNKPLKTALDKARSTGEAAYLPENSTLALHEAKMAIDDMIQSAVTQGNKYEAKKLGDLQKKVLELLDTNTVGKYKDARKTYEFLSRPINEVTDGDFGRFLNKNARPDAVASEVVGMSPTAISQGIMQIGTAKPVRSAARGGMQRRLDNMGETSNLANALLGKAEPKQRLAALMGDDGAENMLRRLELEDRMAKGKNLYFRGSTTASNLLEEETFNNSGKVIDRLVKALSTPLGAAFDTAKDLRNLGLASGKEDLARALAGILFDTQQGAQSLEKILPYAVRRNQIAGSVDDVAAALTKGVRPLGVNAATRKE